MSPKKKQPALLPPRTPAERHAEVLGRLKPIATDHDALDAARALDDQAEYETIYAQVPRGRTTGEDRVVADLVREQIRAARAQLSNATAKALRAHIVEQLKQQGDKSTLAAVREYTPEGWANLVSQTAPRRKGRRS